MNQPITPILLVLSLSGLFFAVNTAGGIKEDVGEYAYHYSKCERYVGGAKGVTHCSKYIPAVEYRVKTITKGLFFDYEGYRVISK